MGTKIRAEVSKSNPYYISKHRYYELKHFCLQYNDFKKVYNSLCEKIPGGIIRSNVLERPRKDDPNYDIRMKYYTKICLIEDSAWLADKDLGGYLIEGVTQERSYDWLLTRRRIPCCKDIYYDRYRRFFWILSVRKDA